MPLTLLHSNEDAPPPPPDEDTFDLTDLATKAAMHSSTMNRKG